MSRSPPDRRGALERGRNAFLARQNGSGCGQWATEAPPHHQPAQTGAAESGLPRKRRCGSDVRRIRARARRMHWQAADDAGGGSQVPMGARGPRAAGGHSHEGRAPGPGPIGPAQCCGGIMKWTRTPAQGVAKGAGGAVKRPPRPPPGQNRAGRPAGTRRAGRTAGGTSGPRPPAGQQRPAALAGWAGTDSEAKSGLGAEIRGHWHVGATKKLQKLATSRY